VLLCGDLNTRPDQTGYRIIRYLGQLRDAYATHHGEPGITFSIDNSYVDSFNQCLDYMLTRNLNTHRIEITLTDTPPDNNARAYSDHYALLAEFEIADNPVTVSPQEIHSTLKTLHERVQIAVAEAENAQGNHIMQMLFALVSLPDVLAASHIVSKHFPCAGKWLRRVGFTGVTGYLLYHLLQAGVNLQARKQTLQSIEHEINTQLESSLLFDEHTLPD
jgi:hypothetical protein